MTFDRQTSSAGLGVDLAAIVRGSVDQVYVVDGLAGRFIYANDRALSDTGFTFDELRGMTPLDLQVGVDVETMVARVASLQSGQREAVTFDTEYRRRDGTTMAVEHHVQYLRAHEPPVYLVQARPLTSGGPRRGPELVSSRLDIDLANIVRESADHIYIIDAITGRYVYANERALAETGYSLEELTTMTLPEIEAGVELGSMLDGIAPLHHGEAQVVSFETEYRRKDGSFVAVEHSVQYLASHDPPVYLLQARLRASETSNGEQEVRSDLYRRMVEEAEDGIWAIDAEQNTLFANDTMARMLGYSRKEMFGMSIFAFMDDDGRAIAKAKLEGRRRGVSERHDFKFVRKDKTALWAIVAANPMFDSQGQYAGAVAIVTDITERKLQEETLLQRLHVSSPEDLMHSPILPILGSSQMPSASALRADRLAKRFGVLADPRRLELIELLANGEERSVNEIGAALGLNQPNASKHLKVLHEAGLVGRRVVGTRTLYSMNDPTAAILCRVVCQWLGNQAHAEYQALAG